MKFLAQAIQLPQLRSAAKSIRNISILAAFGFITACTSSNLNDGLRPNATVGNQTQPQPVELRQEPSNSAALAPIDAPAQNQATQQTASLAPSPGVAFLPVLGPPQSAVSRLSSAVVRSARANSITIIPNGQPGAKYQVKGYFSALDDGSGTRLIYIWDILDQSGRNIHRISGEERTNSRNADPWTAVDANVINAVVERTMQNFQGWLSTRA